MPPHSLTNSEIQKYYQNYVQRSSKNEKKINGVFSRDNLPNKIKGWGIYNKS